MWMNSLSLARAHTGSRKLARYVLLVVFCVAAVVAQAAPRKGSAVGHKTAAAKPQVQFRTNVGEFTVELDPAAAPKTVENFLQYVHSGHSTALFFIASSAISWCKAAGTTPIWNKSQPALQ